MTVYLAFGFIWFLAFGVVAWTLRSRFYSVVALLAPLWPLAFGALCLLGTYRLLVLAVHDR